MVDFSDQIVPAICTIIGVIIGGLFSNIIPHFLQVRSANKIFRKSKLEDLYNDLYTFNGVPRTYYPDFLVKLDNGKTLVLETKGQDSPQVQAKNAALTEWVEAVNSLKEYGEWCSDISFNVADVDGIIAKYASEV